MPWIAFWAFCSLTRLQRCVYTLLLFHFQLWHTHPHTVYVCTDIPLLDLNSQYLKITGEEALESINKESCLWDLEFRILNILLHRFHPESLYYKNKLKLNRLRPRSLNQLDFVSESKLPCPPPWTIRDQRDLEPEYSISESWLGHRT